MAATLLQVLAPAIQIVTNVLIVFFQWIATAASAISSFFGGAKKKSEDTANSVNKIGNGISKATSGVGGLNKGLKDSAKSAEKLRKATMGFDELNVVSKPTSTSGGAGASGGAGGASIPAFTMPTFDGIDFGLDTVKADLDEVKEKVKGILVLAGLVAGGFAAWKILDIITNPAINLKNIFKDIGAYALIIGGALLLVQGYSDAWANGIDWGNFAMIIGGVGAVVAGIALKFGALAGGIALIVGGIAMVVIGIKDLVENGYSMEAVIMVAVGAIAILIGVIWAMNAALLANPITWVVVAIMALVAAFVILWNECDGFRQFFIDMWEAIKKGFNATVEWFKNAGKAIAKFFVDAWNSIKNAWNAAGAWFKNVGQSIKNAFSSIGAWFSNTFKGAWNGVKNAFSSVGSFFKNIWNTIKTTFSNVGATIGNAITNTVKKAINGVLSTAIKIINGFIGAINTAISIINKIPGVSISKLKTLDVPKLAKGGIIDGEQGKEAVMPLENNTEWMNILADKLSEKIGGNTPVILKVDGRVFAETSIKTINDLTRQTGSLQLKLV